MRVTGFGLLGFCMAASVGLKAVAADLPFYRGGEDANIVAAPNGAMVNQSYLDYWRSVQGAREIVAVQPGVHTLRRFHLVNMHVIEGDSSLIVIDTGSKVGHGEDFLEAIRSFSDKPVQAIIYTHHHYVGGARGVIGDQLASSITVFGHPDLEDMLKTTDSILGPMQRRRIARQFGAYLPPEGPDSILPVSEKSFSEPERNASGYLPVTKPVADGEEVVFDGVRMRFHHIVGDTRDSLAIEFPELDMVAHNSAMTSVAFPLYTLRGDFFRAPTDLIAGLDLLRNLRPQYLLNAHGDTITSRELAYETLTVHRDAYSFIWNQSLQAINRGLTPDEMVATIQLPEHLRNDPRIKPIYVDWEYGIRGIYRGMVGWYSEDGSDLHPPMPQEIGDELILGFGGVDKVVARAQQAFDERRYNLAAKLTSWVIAAQPENRMARALKANSLRAMAYATETGVQTRNFMLSEALHLEGKTGWNAPSSQGLFAAPTVQTLMAAPTVELIKSMEARVDLQAALPLTAVISFHVGDARHGLALRRGVAEFMSQAPVQVDMTLALDQETLARLLLGEVSLVDAAEQGMVAVTGDATLVTPLGAALMLNGET